MRRKVLMSYKTIQIGYEGKVATLTLNRPDKRNAISFELIDDLLRALEEISKLGRNANNANNANNADNADNALTQELEARN